MDSIEELPKRIIKFRVWKPIDKRMLSNDWLYSGEVVYSALFDPNRKDLYVMQFTGLLDKNGKEIYDGDILLDSTGYKWIVYWHIDHACFAAKCDRTVVEVLNNQNMSIIGNIYQNPDLL